MRVSRSYLVGCCLVGAAMALLQPWCLVLAQPKLQWSTDRSPPQWPCKVPSDWHQPIHMNSQVGWGIEGKQAFGNGSDVSGQQVTLHSAMQFASSWRFGWPFRSMQLQYGWEHHPEVPKPNPAAWSTGISIPSHVSRRLAFFDLTDLPTSLLPLGLVLNSAFMAGLAFPVSITTSHLWSILRRRNGTCAKCGYDVTGLHQCPECGSSVSSLLVAADPATRMDFTS